MKQGKELKQADTAADATTVRVLTPLAQGAIAVVQISGAAALTIADAVFRPKGEVRLSDVPAGSFLYGNLVNAASQLFDEGLAVRGEAAGRPWVEFNVHGGVRIVQKLVQRAQELGASLIRSEAVESSTGRRIAVNGVSGRLPEPDPSFEWLDPLDRLMQACLPDAQTPRVVEWLSAQSGMWRQRIGKWRRQIDAGELGPVLDQAESMIVEGRESGDIWRGRTIAIIGRPNVGKSTLANRLAGRPVSLVDAAAGTTRDWVGEPGAVGGWPIAIIDTAGLRRSDDDVESQGISLAIRQAQAADIRLLVLDASDPECHSSGVPVDRIGLKAYDIVVYNKCDLLCEWPGNGREHGLAGVSEVGVSSLTGDGWPQLEQAILASCGFAALREQKPLVFCAELQDRVSGLVSALRLQDATGARTVLDTLAVRG